MTDQELQMLVEQVSLTAFQLPFRHQATFNRRLKTTGGRYHLKSHHLDFNPLVIERYDEQTLIQVIKHELCHYHLHLAGRPYQHKDRDFKQLLKKTGGSRYAPVLTDPVYHLYQCEACGTMIRRKRTIDRRRYVCGKCRGKLFFVKLDEPSTD